VTVPTAASALLLLLTLGYLLGCVVWPFGACRRCHGTGKLRAPLGRVYRRCRRCDGTGLRIRIGRHLWNELRRIHRDGTR
jgi:hypothetical protein